MSATLGNFGHNRKGILGGPGAMYAISFDLDTAILKEAYGGPSWTNAYSEIGGVLGDHGFERQQGSVYFGNDEVSAVTCVVAVQELASCFPWFTPSVRDIRMLRIEDNNDLLPAIERASRKRPK